MANVDAIKGINYDDGTERLYPVFAGSIGYLSGGNWTWQGLNMSGTQFEIEKHKNYGYIYAGTGNIPKTINSSDVLSTTNVASGPWGTYPKSVKGRLFLGNCLIPDVNQSYKRRVFYTDITQKDDGVVWGLEFGTNLSQTAADATITSAGAQFISRGIKIGDPVIITSGANEGVYGVREIVSETEIELTDNLASTVASSGYIIGGNWFDLDGAVTGMGEHYTVTLAFEEEKAWRWHPSIGLKPILGVGGTNSHKSIIQHMGYTFWYHPSEGFIRFDGSTAEPWSDKIKRVIDAIPGGVQPVGWIGTGKYKNHVYWYVGDVEVTEYYPDANTSFTNLVIDHNVKTNRWKLHEYNEVITCATSHLESGTWNTYVGTDQSMALQLNTGTGDYDTTEDDGTYLPIAGRAESWPVFPADPEVICLFDTLMSYLQHGTGIKFQYKLNGTPGQTDSEWSDVMELNERYGVTKLKDAQSRGISWQISWIGEETFEIIGLSFIWMVVGEAYDAELS